MLERPRSILTTRDSGAIHALVNKRMETGKRDPPRTIRNWMIWRTIRSIPSCPLVWIERVERARNDAGVNGGSRYPDGHCGGDRAPPPGHQSSQPAIKGGLAK